MVPFELQLQGITRHRAVLLERGLQMREMGRCTKTSIDEFFSGEWADILESALVGGSDWVAIEPEREHAVASRILDLVEQSV